ncbi:MAG: hypothetical protein KAR85_08140 [Methanosarcinales archaeon]|nr:hypothetical protein [Methanosarcinales archaeon]
MGESKDVFIDILNKIEKRKSISLRQIANEMNLNENEVKPIIEIYLKHNFIDNSNKQKIYQMTKAGKDYLRIKS